MTTPLVTVVIPTYNAPALLLETLGTVFAQTFTDFEVVVINDGCTDDTLARLKTITDPRLRVITQENQGIGAARNRGIDEARGKYIAFLDHDDLWMPEKLVTQVAFHEERPECIASTVRWAYSTTPERCVFGEYPEPAALTSRSILPRPIRYFIGCCLFVSSSLMIVRERGQGLRYATRRRCIEDVSFQIQLLARGPFGVCGRDILMVYRIHESNESSRAVFHANGIRLLRKMDRAGEFACPDAAWRGDVERYLARIGHNAIARLLRLGKRREALMLYGREWPYLARSGAWKFLAAFPLLVLAPMGLIKKRWDYEQQLPDEG